MAALPPPNVDPASIEVAGFERPGARTPRRSVSFGVEDSVTVSAMPSADGASAAGIGAGAGGANGAVLNDMSTSSSVASIPVSVSAAGFSAQPSSHPTLSGQPTLRSALKPSASQYKKLPPAVQYQHPDPLLRRLRLVDERGKAINLRKHFGRDVKCVGFYFSSQWAGQPLKEYHKTITNFCLRHPNEFKVVYVSVDVDEQWYKAGIKGKPWVSMVWTDGSSPDPSSSETPSSATTTATQKDLAAMPHPSAALYNAENFLLAGEADIDESLSHSDTSGEAYLRPFSRVHLASKLNIIAAPTLCVYHLPSGKMLDWNVRMAKLNPSREADTWERWQKGEKVASAGVIDVVARRPFTFVLFFISIIYFLFVRIAGPEYNYVARFLLQLDQKYSPIP
ncbi:hypothetical protein K437DRAFT_253190 [Tilletiaria anomala UBC 951]|uniref:Thioredoxin-like fold domain-containing protein n=1 Tax=Tilletiaria anomala (strain ATCC 24038 / CBS 436.72 / UBC 951) TaxID=1037660 RepID=A0A066WS26_TILAU|nr:uncharacterized protein K437DRAFT_253190 [Tilletiaria anomala UBC 951]KDN53485.1 hypothetical protein K437DRAFT_253190 [Tilletiaria anomala UBC 951]